MQEFRTATVAQADHWKQHVRIPYGGTIPGAYDAIPASGKLQITYPAADGSLRYWNGSVFGAIPVTLTTVLDLVAKTSSHDYTHQPETAGKNVTFRGWINNDPVSEHIVVVAVAPATAPVYQMRA